MESFGRTPARCPGPFGWSGGSCFVALWDEAAFSTRGAQWSSHRVIQRQGEGRVPHRMAAPAVSGELCCSQILEQFQKKFKKISPPPSLLFVNWNYTNFNICYMHPCPRRDGKKEVARKDAWHFLFLVAPHLLQHHFPPRPEPLKTLLQATEEHFGTCKDLSTEPHGQMKTRPVLGLISRNTQG